MKQYGPEDFNEMLIGHPDCFESYPFYKYLIGEEGWAIVVHCDYLDIRHLCVIHTYPIKHMSRLCTCVIPDNLFETYKLLLSDYKSYP